MHNYGPYTFLYGTTAYVIPERMRSGLELYVKDHIEPGDFLTAVIRNDLKEAIGRADDENMAVLPAYVNYFYNHAPSPCWGSKEKMDAWLKEGKRKERANEL